MFRSAGKRAYPLVRRLGIDAAFGRSSWRRERLAVLCWHGISLDDEHLWRGWLYINPELFRRRLEVLRDGKYTVLPLDEALERLWRNELPPKSVAITFDDGFYDFVVHAVPVLREFGFPATLYLTTQYVDYAQPVLSVAVPYILWKGHGPGRKLRDGTPAGTPEEALAASNRIVKQALDSKLSMDELNTLVRALAEQVEVDYDLILRRRILQLMNTEEIRQATRGGLITIEAHTHRHRTPPEPELMTQELKDNDARIEKITGRRPRHFCYPSGVVRPEYFEIFKQNGYVSATTCEPGLVTRGSHPYLIPRLLDSMHMSEMQYSGWLSGLFGAIDQIRRSA